MSMLTQAEKRQQNNDRSRAVRESLAREKELVEQGKGTRNWTPEQQKELMNGNRPKDGNGKSFHGHHMKSVSAHPQYASSPSNVQWLSPDEHIQGAHQGTGRNPTNGRYSPETGKTTSLAGRPPKAPEAKELDKPITKSQGQAQGQQHHSENAQSKQHAEVTR